MKKILTLIAVIALTLALVGCEANTSGNISIDPSDIQYVKDTKTGLCFGFVASRKSFDANATGLGMTEVPCDKVYK